MNYTKGPWKWDEDGKESGHYSALHTEKELVIYLRDIFRGYAECGQELVMEIDDENASLISAAPDMYEALKKAIRLMRERNCADADWADDMVDAIAKAEGR